MRSKLSILKLSGIVISETYTQVRIWGSVFQEHNDFQEAVGSGIKRQKFPQLQKNLLEYVKAEYSFFCDLLNLVINMNCKHSHGNMFAQGINDGVTLENHKKYQYVAIQIINPFWKNNLVVCCGFY